MMRTNKLCAGIAADLAIKTRAAMAAVEQIVKPTFTGEVTITVCRGEATELIVEREHPGPPKI